MDRVAIIGSSGQLGYDLVEVLRAEDRLKSLHSIIIRSNVPK